MATYSIIPDFPLSVKIPSRLCRFCYIIKLMNSLKEIHKKHGDKLRFAAVGVINTVVDFGILMALVLMLQAPHTISNIISTGVAFMLSFVLNKNYTFKSKNANTKHQFILFAVVTLFGLWVIQSIIIALLVPLMLGFNLSNGLSTLIAKIIASVVTLIWNFVLYKKIVFKK